MDYRHAFTELGDLIAAPLIAVMEADFAVTEKIKNFILEYGFEKGATDNNDISPTMKLNETYDIGKLKFISFTYYKHEPDLDAKGKSKRCIVNVPLLSLIPIPGLKISDAQFDFDVHLDFVNDKKEPPLTERNRNNDSEPPGPSAKFMGFYAINPGQCDTKLPYDLCANIKASVRVKETEMPAGIIKLLNITSDNVWAREDEAPIPPK